MPAREENDCSCMVSVLYSLYENAAPPHKEDFFMGTTSKSEYTQLCTEILEAVGGSKNVKNVFHCITPASHRSGQPRCGRYGKIE